MRERRTLHRPCSGPSYPDRRKNLWDRREHTGPLRILWIPLDRLVFGFRTVTWS